MALRKLPPGLLRDRGKRRLPTDELAERIVAEAILENWQLGAELGHIAGQPDPGQ